jgi:hypothetical protein
MTFQHLAFGARRLGVRRAAFGVRRSRFGNRFRPRIGTPLFIGALDSDKTFLPRDGWDLPSPAVGDYGATRRYGINVFGAGDAERQTLSAERCRLAQMRFSSQKSKNAGFGRIALANGALQYRNIRYRAADSCL